ncbi:hypothetical protein ACN5TA_004040 [Bacillus cytotoxicus]
MKDYLPVPTYEQYEIARQNGISKQTVDQRIRIGNKTVEEAISIPLQRSEFTQKYKAYIELAKQNGILPNTFYVRMTRNKRKWTPLEAATIPPIPVNERAKKGVRRSGKDELSSAYN